jgi:hypothetical protein
MDANFSSLAQRVEYVSVKEYGATGDGVTDDTDAVQAAFDASNAVYFPAGIYLTTLITATNSDYLLIKGAGRGVTTIKRKDNNVVSDNIQKMAIFYMDGNGSFFDMRDMTWDGNGTNQPNAPEGDEYKYQQSHCVDIKADGADVDSVVVQNVGIIDACADGISITERTDGTFGDLYFRGITETTRTYVRSGITLAANFDRCVVSDCNIDSFEVEHNSIDTENFKNALTMTNCFIDRKLDLNFKHASVSGIYPQLLVNNVSVGLGSTPDNTFLPRWLNIGNCDATISNCIFNMDRQVFIRGFYRVNNCTFNATAEWTGSNTLLEERSIDGGSLEVSVSECRFTAESGAYTNGLRYFYENDNLVDEDNTLYRGTRFINCDFDSTEIKAAYIRNGNFLFDGCTHKYDGTDAASIETGNLRGFAADFYTIHKIHNNFLDSETAWLYQTPPTFDPASDGMGGFLTAVPFLNLSMAGNKTRSGKLLRIQDFTHLDQLDMDAFYGLGEDLRDQIVIKELDQWVALDAAPTAGHWVDGQTVKFNKLVSTNYGAVCTTRGVAGVDAVFANLN